jgi:hypothetical protein
MNCECGGKLIFEHQNDGQFMGGYVYSYKCDKCQMLHFFQNKPSVNPEGNNLNNP